MEITKDIKINTDNLTTTADIIISYTGKLRDSNKIFINFGYTPNSFEYKKLELDNNKEIKIHLNKPGFFYFFFNDENNNLDNNNYKDYQLYIKKSNLVLTDNSSMNKLPYRYIKDIELPNFLYKTFYTTQTIKNTSKPQEIIIPRAFNIQEPTGETKNITGYSIEPIKQIKNYQLSQALIPTDNLSLINTNEKSAFSSKLKELGLALNKLLLAIPKLFGKNYP